MTFPSTYLPLTADLLFSSLWHCIKLLASEYGHYQPNQRQRNGENWT